MDKEERVWKLYKYTCKHNGLIYFGITCKTLDQRWAEKYRGNPKLHNTIQKYGKEGFIREIVLDGLTLEEASQAEIDYIAKYNATDKNIGFNIASGGTAPMYGRKHSKETKEKFSETRKGENNGFYGKHHSEETKEYLREINLGKKHTEEWKQQQSIRSKEWFKTHENPMKDNHCFVGDKNSMYGKTGGEHPTAVPIQQFTLDGVFIQEFPSTTEAAQAMGLYNGSHITECCRGKRHKCSGYIWKYKNQKVHFEDAENNHEQDSDC